MELEADKVKKSLFAELFSLVMGFNSARVLAINFFPNDRLDCSLQAEMISSRPRHEPAWSGEFSSQTANQTASIHISSS